MMRNRWEGRSRREMNVRATNLAYVFRSTANDTILASGMYTPLGWNSYTSIFQPISVPFLCLSAEFNDSFPFALFPFTAK